MGHSQKVGSIAGKASVFEGGGPGPVPSVSRDPVDQKDRIGRQVHSKTGGQGYKSCLVGPVLALFLAVFGTFGRAD